ncbi:MAG: hypothetical protein QOD99_101 [Chthoniobacter sp.]|jgi:tetratricopeptide (TPR) repeat protein|nr:hypothetical protein [Chthoniobacter sp.]
MKNVILLGIGIFLLSIAQEGALGADYLGADSVLKQVAEKADAAVPALSEANTTAKLKRDLKEFRETNANLAPEEAAKRWLELADRFGRLTQEQLAENSDSGESEEEDLSFQTIVSALPPPQVWEALAKALEERPQEANAAGFRTLLLRLTAHWLTRDSAGQETDVAAIEALSQKVKDPMREYIKQCSLAVKTLLLQGSDDGEAILKNLNHTLDLFKAMTPNQYSGMGSRPLEVPDLVSLVGEKKASVFLRAALRTDRLQISITEGDETRKLARKLALGMIADLKVPQWSLAQSLDATVLYEAMVKRFPQNDESNDRFGSGDQQETAQIYYLLGLLASHRTKDAVSVASKLGTKAGISLPSEALAALERAGLTLVLTDFFHDLLAANPDLPFWSEYVELAAKAGGTDKMVALAEASAARKGLSEKQRREIQKYLRQAYLAADKVDAGIDLLRKEIASAAAGKPDDEDGNNPVDDSGLQLARLGALLARPELIDEGIRAAHASINLNTSPRNQDSRRNALNNLAEVLLELDRGTEAEAALTESLAIIVPEQANRPSNPASRQASLIHLMALYYRANRPADVMALLDHAPQWGAKDMAEIYKENVTINRNEEYVGYIAAASLAAVGREPEAHKTIDALLEQEGGYDPAYQLMIKLEPDAASARLDALFARDKYEERPLIWKAKLLFDEGKFEEAETVAKQAIAIDPSDGEQGPGRRMRIYAVLADIREARGDGKEATFLRGVVTAIRHSEDADRFYQAGLISRAVKMYEEALTHFSDAYCIQSRLALRLVELGDMAGAEEHYRRAYELMPDSFGRVESHCFGCERAFEGERAQSIAEKVFTQLAAQRPEKPQVHYLLGYLRNEQDRYREALPEFRQAVKLDPEYLNAWKQLAEVGKKVRLPGADRDLIQLSMLKLDPLGRHTSFDAENITDLRAAWTALEVAAKAKAPQPKELYPLPASTEALAKVEKAHAPSLGRHTQFFRTHRQQDDISPGHMIAQHSFIQGLSSFFSFGEMTFSE